MRIVRLTNKHKLHSKTYARIDEYYIYIHPSDPLYKRMAYVFIAFRQLLA